MKYKLVVLDLDGTLTNSKKEITARNRETLIRIQEQGVRLVLASGRPTYGIVPLANELRMNEFGGFILSYNGGEIINWESKEMMYENVLPNEVIPVLYECARTNHLSILTYDGAEIVTENSQDPYVQKEAFLNKMAVRETNDFLTDITLPVAKCLIVGDADQLIPVESELCIRLQGKINVFRSEPYFLEVLPCGIDKSTSLGALLSHLDITPEEIIVIGDGVCDVSMIQFAGLGIAMGNAQDSVKVCADVVTASNEEDGVALAVEKAILSEIRPAEIPLDQLNERARHALMGNLGIQYTYASEDRVEATMPVDERTRQPFGILHGGATLALAETVAGLGSMILCQPDEIVVGMQVSGNHMSSAHEGDTVRAVGTIIHKGRSSHVWNVDVFTSTDKLVSSIRVVNSILKKR